MINSGGRLQRCRSPIGVPEVEVPIRPEIVEPCISQFPDSQLLSLTRLRELQAEIDANSYEGALAVGHDLLRASPRNLEALILMAGVLPNFPSSYSAARKANSIKEARDDIQAANELLQTFHPMEGFSLASS